MKSTHVFDSQFSFIDTSISGVKFIFKIMETNAFRSINLNYTAQPDPACSAFEFLSDDYWICKMRQDTQCWIHMVGTCSLGPDSASSSTSVVDTKFRFVYIEKTNKKKLEDNHVVHVFLVIHTTEFVV